MNEAEFEQLVDLNHLQVSSCWRQNDVNLFKNIITKLESFEHLNNEYIAAICGSIWEWPEIQLSETQLELLIERVCSRNAVAAIFTIATCIPRNGLKIKKSSWDLLAEINSDLKRTFERIEIVLEKTKADFE